MSGQPERSRTAGLLTMAVSDMFVSYVYTATGVWNHPGFGTKVLPATPPILTEYDVEFWLERLVIEDLVGKYPDFENITVVILHWRRMED